MNSLEERVNKTFNDEEAYQEIIDKAEEVFTNKLIAEKERYDETVELSDNKFDALLYIIDNLYEHFADIEEFYDDEDSTNRIHYMFNSYIPYTRELFINAKIYTREIVGIGIANCSKSIVIEYGLTKLELIRDIYNGEHCFITDKNNIISVPNKYITYDSNFTTIRDIINKYVYSHGKDIISLLELLCQLVNLYEDIRLNLNNKKER